jgi:hypothetical protein
MIKAEEFDKKFDNCEDIDEYIDYDNPLNLEEVVQNSVTITLSDELKNKISQMAKKLILSIEDTIKILLAKEIGVL